MSDFIKSVINILPGAALWLVGSSIFLLVVSPLASIVLMLVFAGCTIIAASYGVVALYEYTIKPMEEIKQDTRLSAANDNKESTP